MRRRGRGVVEKDEGLSACWRCAPPARLRERGRGRGRGLDACYHGKSSGENGGTAMHYRAASQAGGYLEPGSLLPAPALTSAPLPQGGRGEKTGASLTPGAAPKTKPATLARGRFHTAGRIS
ncbi:hypothetical protein CBM2606_A140443 [Cupriavidus taiwanensis]|nr:hypothetical protein CBM2606_A140443 [Cupriavidus taiwanensis]